MHQLRPGTEVPKRVTDVDMPKIGGQDWHAPFGIFAGAVPSQEGHRSKSVTKIMKAWPMAVHGTAKTYLARKRIKRSMDWGGIHPIPPVRNEEVGGHCSPGSVTLAALEIVRQHAAGRSVQGYQARLAELGAPDRQEPRLQVDVLEFQVARLTKPQTSDAQEAEQAVIGPWP